MAASKISPFLKESIHEIGDWLQGRPLLFLMYFLLSVSHKGYYYSES